MTPIGLQPAVNKHIYIIRDINVNWGAQATSGGHAHAPTKNIMYIIIGWCESTRLATFLAYSIGGPNQMAPYHANSIQNTPHHLIHQQIKHTIRKIIQSLQGKNELSS